MSQSPWDQQSYDPFRDQQSGGLQPVGFDQPVPMQPQKKRNPFRACLLQCVLVFACCFLSVGGVIGYFVYNTSDLAPVAWWGDMVVGHGDHMDNIVCEGSQAETYSQAFSQKYNRITGLDVTTIKKNKKDHSITMVGTVTNNQTTEISFNLTMVTDPDHGKGLLKPFGCIRSITGNPPMSDSPAE